MLVGETIWTDQSRTDDNTHAQRHKQKEVCAEERKQQRERTTKENTCGKNCVHERAQKVYRIGINRMCAE